MSLKVALSDAVRDQVEAAATAAGTSIAEQVRWRAEWLLNHPALNHPADPPTLALMAAVADMAATVERETGAPWHAHAGSYAVLRQAILSRLARIKVEGKLEGDPAFGPRPHRAAPQDDPAELGVQLEFDDWIGRDDTPERRRRIRLMAEETFQEIARLHQQRQQREQGGGDEGEVT